MARWLKAEFLQYSHAGGFLVLVDLLSGFGVGVDGGGLGFMMGVGSGEGGAGLAIVVGVMSEVGFGLSLVWGESDRCKVGGSGSISILVGDMGGVVSLLGVWGSGLVGGLGDVVVSSGVEVGGR